VDAKGRLKAKYGSVQDRDQRQRNLARFESPIPARRQRWKSERMCTIRKDATQDGKSRFTQRFYRRLRRKCNSIPRQHFAVKRSSPGVKRRLLKFFQHRRKVVAFEGRHEMTGSAAEGEKFVRGGRHWLLAARAIRPPFKLSVIQPPELRPVSLDERFRIGASDGMLFELFAELFQLGASFLQRFIFLCGEQRPLVNRQQPVTD
jgi:hypothetical protein